MKYTFSLLLLLISGAIALCQDNPFPSGEEIANAKRGDLILKQGSYLKYKADYGTLVIPENRKNAKARLITLPVIRIHAKSDNPAEPVFFLTGGPGAKNVYTEDVFIKAGQEDLKTLGFLLEHHDLVVVGYRGVDGSVVLNCPEVTEALKGKKKPLSNENLKALGYALTSAFRRFEEEGIDLNGYNVVEVVDDIEAVRAALKYEKINLWGGSYGTTIAYIYCSKYPERSHRVLMTGATSPGYIWEPEVVDDQLKYYANLWERNPECVERSPDLIQTIRNVLMNLPEKWQDMPIDIDKIKILSFYFLYDTGPSAQIFDAFVSAEKGKYGKLVYLSYAYDVAFPSSVIWGDFFIKLLTFGNIDLEKNYALEMDPPGFILGSPMAKLLYGALKYANLSIQPIQNIFRESHNVESQILLVSGSIDFSSPVENVKKDFLPYLRNGQLVVLSEMGHNDVTGIIQPEAFQHMVESFFLKGIVDDSKFHYEPMDFITDQPFMKWLMGMAN